MFEHNNPLVLLPERLRRPVAGLSGGVLARITEVRLRTGRPLMVVSPEGDWFLTPAGELTRDPHRGIGVQEEDVTGFLHLATKSSLYALEEELRQGFITVEGGHRVGLAGRAVMAGGQVRTLKDISGINLRFCREVPGAADAVLPEVLAGPGEVRNTLIYSPPGCGKTTLLRDLVRQLSDGVPSLGCSGFRVALVDERSELAGCWRGVPQLQVGVRTDVLDGCPKAVGMAMLLRAMSPQVMATDELGRPEDAAAVWDCINAGVRILTTAHGGSVEDLLARPTLRELMQGGAFSRLILLGFSRGVGTIEGVYDGETLSESRAGAMTRPGLRAAREGRQ